MYRSMLYAAVAGLGLVSLGTTESFAQSGAQPRLRPTDPQLYLKQYGLLVTMVAPGSTAARQGLEPGDIIASVDGNPVRSIADLNYWVGRSGRVAELQVIDRNTGWQNQVLVYPRFGRIGVAAQPVPLDGGRPLPPIYPGSDRNVGPLPRPWPLNPDRRGTMPTPWPLPTNPANPGGQPIPLPGPGGLPGR
jgi:hypothetical protein